MIELLQSAPLVNGPTLPAARRLRLSPYKSYEVMLSVQEMKAAPNMKTQGVIQCILDSSPANESSPKMKTQGPWKHFLPQKLININLLLFVCFCFMSGPWLIQLIQTEQLSYSSLGSWWDTQMQTYWRYWIRLFRPWSCQGWESFRPPLPSTTPRREVSKTCQEHVVCVVPITGVHSPLVLEKKNLTKAQQLLGLSGQSHWKLSHRHQKNDTVLVFIVTVVAINLSASIL